VAARIFTIYNDDRGITMHQVLLLSILIFSFSPGLLAITEIGGDFGYDKQLYGTKNESSFVTRTYSGTVAIYFYNWTGIEFNYSNVENINTDNGVSEITEYNVEQISKQSRIRTEVWGVGIRQALADQGSFVKPMVSLGYAKQTDTYSSEATYEGISTGDRIVYRIPSERRKCDSVFAAFILQIKLIRGLSLKGSVKSIFPAFEFDKASDNLKYLAGFSWAF